MSPRRIYVVILASIKDKLLCKSKIKDSTTKVKLSKVKKTKVLHNNEDTFII
jgi:hypothetical protein